MSSSYGLFRLFDMPEETEVDTDSLREKIDEQREKRGGSFLRWISLTTALLAALAAIASLKAGATVNEALVLKTDATRLQAQASDQWAYYPAKGIKGAVALLQIAIALGAIAALTGSRFVWFGSMGLGVVAAILLAVPILRG